MSTEPEAPIAANDAYVAERAKLLEAFGAKLRSVREHRNLSQDALAEIASVHRTHISALELGLRDPHLSMLLILGDTLGVTLDALCEGLLVPRERKAPTHSKRGRPA